MYARIFWKQLVQKNEHFLWILRENGVEDVKTIIYFLRTTNVALRIFEGQ